MQFRGSHKLGQYFIAFLFIAWGGLLLARNMEWITQAVYHALASWQAVLAVLGIYSLCRRRYVWGLVLLGISAYCFNDMLSSLLCTDLQAFMLPAVLVLIGLAVIFGSTRQHRSGHWKRQRPEEFATVDYTSVDGFLHSENTFSGVRQVMLDELLKGGIIRTRLGGTIIDLRRTDIVIGETILDIECNLGSVELYVPADWTVKYLCNTIMGGYEDKRWERRENPEKVLLLRGSVSLGSVEVKS